MKNLIFFLAVLLSCNSNGQIEKSDESEPKLVVGITIDQMRADFLTRFKEHFTDGGFARIIDGGFTCWDHHYGYAPTFTGPGHASIYTGTTPSIHGIVANDWFVRDLGATVYCASDTSVRGVGLIGVDHDASMFQIYGQMSPTRLLSSTLGDEMKIASGASSEGSGAAGAKVIGISIKDRGAILPAGHAGDAAYWFYGKDKGHFITSTYYREDLPRWAAEYNNSGAAQSYCDGGWDRLLGEEAYSGCLPDNNPFEGSFTGEIQPTFPYDLNGLKAANSGFDVLKATPAGNTMIVDFALAAIDGEGLGEDEVCDLIAMSFSATDYVGHRCGPNAQETMDMYVRLDRELERFFDALDRKIGKGKWTVFITSDHGAAAVPSHAASLGLPNDYWTHGNMQISIEDELDKRFGQKDWIQNISNNAIFINPNAISSSGASDSEIQRFVSKLCIEEEAIMQSIPAVDLAIRASADPIAQSIYNGHKPGTSGDVMLVLNPGWIKYGRTGTTHGSPYAYDTHVPCLFYGSGVNSGSTFSKTYTRDIAPTISAILGIPYPNGTTGSPIGEAILK